MVKAEVPCAEQQRRCDVLAGHLAPEEAKDVASGVSMLPAAAAAAAAASGSASKALVTLRRQGPVAVVEINNPPVNALSPGVMDALANAMIAAREDKQVRAIVLTGARSRFVAGADIGYIMQAQQNPTAMGDFIRTCHATLNAMEDGAKPVVAAIQGLALGGGLEIAMACHARIATPDTKLGLPELNLGIIPGFGGTQRLPRLVGAEMAVKAILTSRPFGAKQAAQAGLLDQIVDPAKLMASAVALATSLASGTRPLRRSLRLTDKVNDASRAVVAKAMKTTRPELPHQAAALNAVLVGLESNGVYGCRVEIDEFLKVSSTPSARAMVHVFFASRATSKVPGVTDVGVRPRAIKLVGVIGGGLMGSGIATALLSRGFTVIVKEINQKFLDGALARIKKNLAAFAKRGKLRGDLASVTARLSGTLDDKAFAKADMVIEAATENVALKQKIFAMLEKVVSPQCILATNTSTINIDVVSRLTSAQDRFVGMHFFSPAQIMPLVEVIRTDTVGVQALVDTLSVVQRLGKTPILVGNCPGFTVNRIFFPYLQAAEFLLNQGADPYHVDKVVARFGMPMGPFRLGDLVGIDVSMFVNQLLNAAFPDRAYPNTTGTMMVKELKRLGEKSGAGYYKYTKGANGRVAAQPDPSFKQIQERARTAAGLANTIKPAFTDEEIVQILLYPVINESCRVLDEGLVVRASDVDIGSIMGYGFPVWRGGILKWADEVGARTISAKLTELAARFGQGLFTPCDYLLRRSAVAAALSSKTIPAAAPVLTVRNDNDVVIVAARRSPVGKAYRGSFARTKEDDLLAPVLRAVLADARGVSLDSIGDVVVGNVLAKGDIGAVQARVACLLAGLPDSVPVRTVNRLCSSGLQSMADVAASITAGYYDVGVAAGVESMSSWPMSNDIKPNPAALADKTIRGCYLPMGVTSEHVAERFNVTRADQDAFAVESNTRATRARAAGRFDKEIVPITASVMDRKTKKVSQKIVTQDECIKPGTTMESLSKLKTVFKKVNGTTTAGNASQLSDGAAACVMMTRGMARRLGLPVMGTFRTFAAVGVEPSVMGIGPAVAIPAALSKAGLSIDDIGLWEINEAFASQASYVVRKLGLDPEIVNVNGGAIALGHPLGCTGTRMSVTLLHEMERRNARFGVVSMCIGSGMGAAAVFERDV